MFEELKEKTFRKCLVTAAVLLIAGVALTVCTASDTYYSVFGYVDFISLEPGQIRSQLVDLDLTVNFGCYLEKYEYNTKTHYRKTTDLYYIIWTGDEYATDFRYMSLRVPASFEGQMEEMAVNTNNNILSDAIHISGKIKKLGSEEYDYFVKTLKEAGWTQEEIDSYTIPYYIDYRSNKNALIAVTILLFIGGIALIAAGIYRIIKGKKGGFLEKFRQDIGISGYSESCVESDYTAAKSLTKKGDLKMGRLMTYYYLNSEFRAIPHNKVMWAYQNTTTHRTNGVKTGTTYSVMFFAEGYKGPFNLAVPSEAAAQEILTMLYTHCPWIVVGYSDDLKKLYNKDRAQFLQLRYNTVEHNPIDPELGEAGNQ